MHGVLEDRAPRTQLHDLSQVHHADAVGDPLDDGEVMADEEVRQAELVLEVHHQVDDLRLDRDVQRRNCLIGDHQLGSQRQRAGNADALTLPPGELVGVLPHVVGRHADSAQQVGHDVAGLALGHCPVNLERLGNRLADSSTGVEAREGVLEHNLRLAAVGSQCPGTEIGDVCAVERDRAARRIQQTDDQVRQRRLAAAALAHHSQRLATIDVEADLFDGVHAGAVTGREVLGERFDLDDRHRRVLLGHESVSLSSAVPVSGGREPPSVSTSASGSIRLNRWGDSWPAMDPSRGTAASSDWV